MPDPRSDRVFKQIFHNHPRALIHLLNSFLPLVDTIEAIEYMPVELQSDLAGLHMPIVDVRCRDTAGRHFIVEMQVQKKPLFFRRVMMNACRIYSRQGSLGGRLDEVCPVYSLCLLDYPMFKEKSGWVHHAETQTSGDGPVPLGELHFTFVEMRKWLKSGTFDSEDIRDAWMMFFTQPERMKDIFTPELRARYKEMWEAVRAWDLTKHSEHDLWAMDKTVQDLWTYEAYMLQAHDEGLEKGRAVGLEQGREQGREEGREEGREQGREQGREEGLRTGFENGVDGILAALQFLKENPAVSDEELMQRFTVSAETVARIRSMMQG